jgi:hypothetical protein
MIPKNGKKSSGQRQFRTKIIKKVIKRNNNRNWRLKKTYPEILQKRTDPYRFLQFVSGSVQ